MGTLGNTFDNVSSKYGHARKVWREVRQVYPAGGTVSNVADWSAAGVIPAGTAVKYDVTNKTMECYTKADITGAEDMSTLAINGYLKNDIRIESESTVASGTVVYEGELYINLIDDEIAAKLKTVTTTPMVVFVE